MSMHFENIDSFKQPDTLTIERICSTTGSALTALARTPVYWVSPALMDELYEPWRNVLLVGDCIEKAIERLSGDGRKRSDEASIIPEIEGFWNKLEECCSGMDRVYRPAAGVYFESIQASALAAIKKARKGHGTLRQVPAVGASAVFVCPERCIERIDGIAETSLTKAQAIECAVAQTVFHELHHAWFKTDPAMYRTYWGRLIEESLCEWASFSSFDTREERALLNRLMCDTPVEYRCYQYWLNRSWRRAWPGRYRGEEEFDGILPAWKDKGAGALLDASGRSPQWVDSLFRCRLDEFASNHPSLSRIQLFELFWKKAGMDMLKWMYR